MTKEALYYKEKSNNKVTCTLCPHECSLSENKRGKCKVRINIQGKLLSENYNLISAIHSDPIEKKPLYHFYPGKKYSFGWKYRLQYEMQFLSELFNIPNKYS
jgi:pyruvate formate lyase activating enzyme